MTESKEKLSYEELKRLAYDMAQHLEFCGYGDSWERECARDSGLIKRVDNWLAKVPCE